MERIQIDTLIVGSVFSVFSSTTIKRDQLVLLFHIKGQRQQTRIVIVSRLVKILQQKSGKITFYV